MAMHGAPKNRSRHNARAHLHKDAKKKVNKIQKRKVSSVGDSKASSAAMKAATAQQEMQQEQAASASAQLKAKRRRKFVSSSADESSSTQHSSNIEFNTNSFQSNAMSQEMFHKVSSLYHAMKNHIENTAQGADDSTDAFAKQRHRRRRFVNSGANTQTFNIAGQTTSFGLDSGLETLFAGSDATENFKKRKRFVATENGVEAASHNMKFDSVQQDTAFNSASSISTEAGSDEGSGSGGSSSSGGHSIRRKAPRRKGGRKAKKIRINWGDGVTSAVGGQIAGGAGGLLGVLAALGGAISSATTLGDVWGGLFLGTQAEQSSNDQSSLDVAATAQDPGV